MGEVRVALASLFVATAIVACTAAPTAGAVSDDGDADPPAVPDPPPRYAFVAPSDASASERDGASELHIKCGRDKPYVCPLDDAGFACSSVPCLPDCTRIGCVGGDVCTACDGGYRCVAPGEGC